MESGKKQAMLRVAVAAFFSFLLSLSLSLLMIAVVVHNTVFNYKYLESSIEKSGYSGYIKDQIDDYLASYGLSSGFDEEFFTAVVAIEDVTRDTLAQARYIYYPDEVPEYEQEFRDKLSARLIENVRERDIEITEQAEEGIQYLVDLCAETYMEFLSMPSVSTAMGFILPVKRLLIPLEIGLSAFVILCTVMLVLMYKRNHAYIRFLLYSLGGMALTISLPALAVLIMRFIDRAGIASQSLYRLFVVYVSDILYLILIISAISLVVMAVLGVIRFLILRTAHNHKGNSDLVME